MTKQEELTKLQDRQVELLTVMAKSDGKAAKCAKMGKVFAEEYPKEYSEYVKANEEYNSNEFLVELLEGEIREEENSDIQM